MNRFWLRLLLLLLCLAGGLAPRVAHAQISTPYDPLNPNASNPAVPKTVRPDTARIRKPTAADKRKKAAEDSLRRTETLFGKRVTRPAKAGYLAFVPGLGQIYNKRYWKLPIVYGGLGTTVGILIFEQQALTEYTKASDKILAGTALGDASLGPRASQETSSTNIDNGVIFYRHYRDAFVLYSTLVYGIQILDAIVDAHLHGFDVSDDLTLHWQPALLPVPGSLLALPTAPGLTLALRPRIRPSKPRL